MLPWKNLNNGDISTAGLLNLSTIDMLEWMILCLEVGKCPVHCRMFKSNAGVYPLDASSFPSPQWNNQKYLRHCQVFLEGKITLR